MTFKDLYNQYLKDESEKSEPYIALHKKDTIYDYVYEHFSEPYNSEKCIIEMENITNKHKDDCDKIGIEYQVFGTPTNTKWIKF